MMHDTTWKTGFDFNYLYQYTHNRSIPHKYISTPYSDQSVLALTFKGCREAVGNGVELYSRQDVYDRVILWRIPLLVLWLTASRPSFGIHTQVFTLIHLIVDPIDTIWSLLYRLDLAQRTIRWTREKEENEEENEKEKVSFSFCPSVLEHDEDEADQDETDIEEDRAKMERVIKMHKEKDSELLQYFRDVPALIIVAYDEWGIGEEALEAMQYFS